ncbi:hypothetical protein QTP88_024713 [Uroleucon formosanum]
MPHCVDAYLPRGTGLTEAARQKLLRLDAPVYSVVKPPKSGNCTVSKECILPVISVADLKELINDPENISQRSEKINDLRQKLDTIIEDGCWDLNDILLEHNYSDSTVFDWKRLIARTKCQECIEGLKNLNSTFGSEADLVQAKTKGYLTHPDHNFEKTRTMFCNKKQNIKIMKYNLNKIPIEGNILIIDHGHISGNGKPYASKILESPTWLEICKIANDLIITTGTYFFKYLNDICVVHDLENIKICCLGMGVLSYVNKKIEIESPCYYNLDEKLKKYLGFQNRTFDFSLDINTSTMYVPNSNEQYINIEKQCEFRLGRNGQIPLGTIFIGIYSINEIENVFNSFGAIYVANFPKIKFEIINGFLNVTASIGLCFDEYLSNCLGFDYIGNFKKLIPINKTWPRGKEIVLGVEYTEPDIAYTVIGIKKPNLYTNVFLKNFNGVIRSNKVKTLIKGNYSIDQLNSKLPPGIKLQNDKNCITLTSKTDFYMDQNFKLSLGIENMYFLYKHNGDILNNKSLLDVHCNIIEKSFSSINDKCHIEEDLLYNFYYNDDNPYIKTNPIKYIPVNGGFQEIKIDIINQDGKKYDFDDDNFIVYLDLIKE